MAHKLQNAGGRCYERIVEHFGAEVLDDEKNRPKKLGAIVLQMQKNYSFKSDDPSRS